MASEWRWAVDADQVEGDFWIEAALDDSGEVLMIQMHGGPSGDQEVRLYFEEFDDLVASVGRMRKQREKDVAAFKDQQRLRYWKRGGE